jgi:uncharacterized repeat protein (TIGR03803 family)
MPKRNPILTQMLSRMLSAALVVVWVIAVIGMSVQRGRAADKEKVLYTFRDTTISGAHPHAGLVSDTAGNLYGTTVQGGLKNQGTVFQLTPTTNGRWIEILLYSFCSARYCRDGEEPFASLVLDPAGNLYGTTQFGGAWGYGTVFQISPGVNGTWTETVVRSFDISSRGGGVYPLASLIFDATGHLYGTTQQGGVYGFGTVFRLTLGTNGKWTEEALHNFNQNGKDGFYPSGGLIFDAAGNVYGITGKGGAYNYGTIFRLAPGTNGRWTETVLHSFNNKNGADPQTGLIFDQAGNLYGTTLYGGASGTNCGQGCGTVFQLAPGTNGKWTEKVLHNFNNTAKDGNSPWAGLIFDAAGNLYGATAAGGIYGDGTVFQLAPGTNGKWTEKILHSFNQTGQGGYSPYGSLIFDAAGNLYSTTVEGGNSRCSFGCGTVLEITP